MHERPPFPREIEAEPDVAAALRVRLTRSEARLWSGGDVEAARITFTPPLAASLAAAARGGGLVPGLEAVAARLDGEARGLDVADARQGARRPARVSRLLLVADDGAERFYREVERVARRHAARLLVCRLTIDAEGLGLAVNGRPSRMKAVLLEDKRIVAAALRAIAAAAA